MRGGTTPRPALWNEAGTWERISKFDQGRLVEFRKERVKIGEISDVSERSRFGRMRRRIALFPRIRPVRSNVPDGIQRSSSSRPFAGNARERQFLPLNWIQSGAFSKPERIGLFGFDMLPRPELAGKRSHCAGAIEPHPGIELPRKD